MKHKSVGIMELQSWQCACLVPEEPAPQYCGLPATRPFRMCEHHAKAYLEKPADRTTTSFRRKRNPYLVNGSASGVGLAPVQSSAEEHVEDHPRTHRAGAAK